MSKIHFDIIISIINHGHGDRGGGGHRDRGGAVTVTVVYIISERKQSFFSEREHALDKISERKQSFFSEREHALDKML